MRKEIINEMIRLRNQGKTLQYIADLMTTKYPEEKPFSANKVNYYTKNAQCEEIVSAQDILYNNRVYVVNMRKDFKTNKEIAERFGVEESDVEEFLSKRRKLSEEDSRQIYYLYSQGQTFEQIANEYNVNIKSIEKIIAKSNVLITNTDTNKKLECVNVINNFLDLFSDLDNRSEILLSEISDINKKITDKMHSIELKEYTDEEKISIFDEIKTILTDRRNKKDELDILNSLAGFNDNGKIDRLSEIINSKQNRVYFLKSKQVEDNE